MKTVRRAAFALGQFAMGIRNERTVNPIFAEG